MPHASSWCQGNQQHHPMVPFDFIDVLVNLLLWDVNDSSFVRKPSCSSREVLWWLYHCPLCLLAHHFSPNYWLGTTSNTINNALTVACGKIFPGKPASIFLGWNLQEFHHISILKFRRSGAICPNYLLCYTRTIWNQIVLLKSLYKHCHSVFCFILCVWTHKECLAYPIMHCCCCKQSDTTSTPKTHLDTHRSNSLQSPFAKFWQLDFPGHFETALLEFIWH